VTPEEIRSKDVGEHDEYGLYSHGNFVMLREIAAQFAEHNQQLRDERLQRKVWRDEDQAQTKTRDEVLASMAAVQAEGAAHLAQSTPVRVEMPGLVTHLGCIIREPDGAYKIATNQGQLLELSEADFQRIFAAPISEVKQ
jgi:hypothetical protein